MNNSQEAGGNGDKKPWNTDKREMNYAYIDWQNVNLSIQWQGWKVDWKKLREYLRREYNVEKAYIFIGYVPENQEMYTFFQDLWYILIFKPVTNLKDGTTKGNVDAELVLQVMIDFNDYDKAVIITGDGDFSSLINHLYKKNKLLYLIVPNMAKSSNFLKNSAREKIESLANLKKRLEYKK